MNRKKGTASRVFSALSDADVNIRMIDQGSSELNIIIGVENGDCQKAIKAIYREINAAKQNRASARQSVYRGGNGANSFMRMRGGCFVLQSKQFTASLTKSEFQPKT